MNPQNIILSTCRLMVVALLAATLSVGCRQTENTTHTAESQAKPEPFSLPALEYIEILTGGATAKQQLPLIIAVHGLGDTPQNFASLVKGFDAPARFILPRAPITWGNGFAWFEVRLADGNWNRLAKGIQQSASRVAALATLLEKTKPTVGRPILTGFSQGGMISFAVAISHPESIGISLPLSGVLPEKLWPTTRPKPETSVTIRAFHGAADQLVPLAPTQAAVAHLKQLGYDVALVEYPGMTHTIGNQTEADLFAAIKRQIRSGIRD
jgi:phospholipase/carboxylesterase